MQVATELLGQFSLGGVVNSEATARPSISPSPSCTVVAISKCRRRERASSIETLDDPKGTMH